MNKSESIVKISAALVKAQKVIGGAVKDAANPFYKSIYANLNAVMDACKDGLNQNGISVLQPVSSGPDGDSVETILLHESGEFISSTMRLILAKSDMQAYGSAVSYARRYSLQSMCFIGSEDDDDGEKAVGRTTAPHKITLPKVDVGLTKTSEGHKKTEVAAPVATKAPEVPKTETSKPASATIGPAAAAVKTAAEAPKVDPAKPVEVKKEAPKTQPAVAARVTAGW